MQASVLNYPDYLVFDIDPYIYSGLEAKGEEPEYNKKGFAMGKRVAFWINDLLKEMSLRAVVKTSGKTGLHVFVPIERTVTFDGAREICEMVGRHVLKQHPRDVTMEWATQKRTGKIFIDYNMNVRGKTLNVAYSPRGYRGRRSRCRSPGMSWKRPSRVTSRCEMCCRAWKKPGTGGMMFSRRNRALRKPSEVKPESENRPKFKPVEKVPSWPCAPSVH